MHQYNFIPDDDSMNEGTEDTVESLKKELNDKTIIIADLREELQRIQSESQLKLEEEIANSTNLEKQLQESRDLRTDMKAALQAQEEKVNYLESQSAENEGLGRKFEELNKVLEEKDSMMQNYLMQIAKLQEVLQQTENEIDGIESSHLEIQEQLQQEIQRAEDRAGQISDDKSRESQNVLSRDQHIRTVLAETEIGKITLYIVDYFANTRKKRALALETLASELKLAPIMVRTHLRNLHALGVCKFDEVSKEIKLTKM